MLKVMILNKREKETKTDIVNALLATLIFFVIFLLVLHFLKGWP